MISDVTEGRLKVTDLSDITLVVAITEIVRFWHREVEVTRAAQTIA